MKFKMYAKLHQIGLENKNLAYLLILKDVLSLNVRKE